ncbi:histidyl-tRNA synthetase [Geoalkalibacter ferrihydriticus]|uniref:Histidine--tRNA ligase n=2 Tax=Geoalkalibacter ferrihydriticus TaxID=392333 RepID=A0A0C2HIR5_9BACT|nr:histidine--tRNA ligase [Geoalkalibacter ferrihydriticus]KIH76946.1 histidyl-tRNA synthetase [Geoalkalibacter ferrihydriticus DSM 17813]SDL43122.1 histidyl-tRNA synthetase [Geoalkalibacter ferrihydriticus]
MSITGIKGMNDILPGEVETWQFLEVAARRVFALHGFSEIRVPVVEKTELFCRSIGETTDIVEKEMYSFCDKGGTSLTLRPEGTAAVMRAFIQHKLHALDPVAKLYYLGPMFRYERPQKGRYRQFHQIGAEAVGVDDPRIDAQILAMLQHFFDEIGLDDLDLQVNSLGCPQCRPLYRTQLVDFLETRLGDLCDDCRRRYTTNPLRVLDCKATGCGEATAAAPAMLDHLCEGCDEHFTAVRLHLEDIGARFTINRRMVRGLDYYTRTTFEMVTANLGAQNAVAAGGRYDGLVRQLGGPALPGIGFAMGVERLVLLMGEDRRAVQPPDIFLAALGDVAQRRVFSLMHDLQRRGVRAEIDYQGRSLKAQMRRADKLGAARVLIVGEDELTRGVGQLRNMGDSTQREVSLDELPRELGAK